ncbi:MAG: class I SAM-dependent methyltransferase [Anaeromyxobacter sp.]
MPDAQPPPPSPERRSGLRINRTSPPPGQQVFRESALAHRLLDGLRGLEIGGASHNPFGLATRNVDYTGDLDTVFKQEEALRAGRPMPVDLVAPGDRLPVPDGSEDFVVSSHVLEHFFDPIAALQEWFRVIRPGGFIFAIVPHKERTFDAPRPRTTLQELIERHDGRRALAPGVDLHTHHSVWITQDLVELIRHLGWPLVAVQDMDDKVGNGFTVVIQKPPRPGAGAEVRP